jgi:DNA-binding NarL/FixJ family response regulator
MPEAPAGPRVRTPEDAAPSRHPNGTGMMRRTLRVALADDHVLMLVGIRRTLERARDIAIVAEATTGRELLALVPAAAPDVVLLDLYMPDGDGLATLSALREHRPEITVIILSASEEPRDVELALAGGAAGYISKSIDPRDLPATIHQIVDGGGGRRDGRPVGAAREPARGPDESGRRLSARELAILRLVAEGLSNGEVGRRLGITEQTVKFHLANVYRKLGVANRTEATRVAHLSGLLPDAAAVAPPLAGAGL